MIKRVTRSPVCFARYLIFSRVPRPVMVWEVDHGGELPRYYRRRIEVDLNAKRCSGCGVEFTPVG